MTKMKFTNEDAVFTLFFVVFITGLYDWCAHKVINFNTVCLLSLMLLSMVNSLRSKVDKLEQQVTDLKKRIEGLEGSKAK